MAASVHFKLTHNGETRRFAISRSSEGLFDEVMARVTSTVGTAQLRLFWKDVDSPSISRPCFPLDTPDDLRRAVNHIVTYNEENKPPCVHLVVEATAAAAAAVAEQQQAVAAHEPTEEEIEQLDYCRSINEIAADHFLEFEEKEIEEEEEDEVKSMYADDELNERCERGAAEQGEDDEDELQEVDAAEEFLESEEEDGAATDEESEQDEAASVDEDDEDGAVTGEESDEEEDSEEDSVAEAESDSEKEEEEETVQDDKEDVDESEEEEDYLDVLERRLQTAADVIAKEFRPLAEAAEVQLQAAVKRVKQAAAEIEAAARSGIKEVSEFFDKLADGPVETAEPDSEASEEENPEPVEAKETKEEPEPENRKTAKECDDCEQLKYRVIELEMELMKERLASQFIRPEPAQCPCGSEVDDEPCVKATVDSEGDYLFD